MMLPPVQPGRLDLLLLALAEHGCRRYVESRLRVPLWENGLGKFVERKIGAMGVPQQPVQSVQIGQLRLPISFFELWARAAGLLPTPPKPELPTSGGGQ